MGSKNLLTEPVGIMIPVLLMESAWVKMQVMKLLKRIKILVGTLGCSLTPAA